MSKRGGYGQHEAKKGIFDRKGNLVNEYPDYATRQKAVDSGWELYGRMKREPEKPIVPIQINITADTAARIERLTGLAVEAHYVQGSEREPASAPAEVGSPATGEA